MENLFNYSVLLDNQYSSQTKDSARMVKIDFEPPPRPPPFHPKEAPGTFDASFEKRDTVVARRRNRQK